MSTGARAQYGATATVEAPPEGGRALSADLRRAPELRQYAQGGALQPSYLSVRGTPPLQSRVFFGPMPLDPLATGALDLAMVARTLPWERRLDASGGTPRSMPHLLGGSLRLDPQVEAATRASLRAGAFGERGLMLAHGTGTWVVAIEGTEARNDFVFTDDRGTQLQQDDDQRVRRRNADGRRASLLLGAQQRFGRHRLQAGLWVAGLERGLAGPGLRPSRDARQAERLATAYLRLEREPKHLGWGYRSETALLHSHLGVDDTLGEVTLLPTQAQTRALRLQQGAELSYAFARPWRVTGGLTLSHERLSRDLQLGEVLPEAQLTRGVLSAGLDGQLVPQLALRAESRLDLEAVQCSDAACGAFEQALPTGQVALDWYPGPKAWRIATTLTAGARRPALLERFGDGGRVLAAAGLQAERGVTATVGTDYARAFGALRLGLHAEAFAGHAWSLIRFVRTDQFQARARNIDRARRFGTELSGELRMARWLALEHATSWLRTRSAEGAPLPVTPAWTQWSELRAGYGVDMARGVWLRLASRYQHESFADRAGLTRLPAFWHVGTGFAAHYADFRMRFDLEDLLDRGGQTLIGYPLAGRRWMLSLDYSATFP